MLEKLPSGVGRALRKVRAGFQEIVSEDDAFVDIPDSIGLESPAFENGMPIPARYRADGEGLSPPLRWRGVPAHAASLVLIVEDPDAPTPEPLVHLIAWDLPPALPELPEGLFRSPRHTGVDERLGRNTYLQPAWLPPDPPSGHGPHLYAFQLFALDQALAFSGHPTRGAVARTMKDKVIAKGLLAARYERR